MTFIKGQSGNAKGRPPKERALTALLETSGTATEKRAVAKLAWRLATTGVLTLPDGRTLDADLDQWLAAVKWLYGQVDGPPKQGLEVTGADGGPVMVREYVGVDPDAV